MLPREYVPQAVQPLARLAFPAWNEGNANPRPFVWHKTTDQVFDNLAGYLDRIPDSGHQELVGVGPCATIG